MRLANVSCFDMHFFLMYSLLQAAMSGIKRKIEGNDPDYEDISLIQNSKRNKAAEHNGKFMLWTLRQHTCFTCCDSQQVTALMWSLVFDMCSSCFVSPGSSSTEDWNHHQRAVFFGDEEQRAWVRCVKSGTWMRKCLFFFSLCYVLTLGL